MDGWAGMWATARGLGGGTQPVLRGGPAPPSTTTPLPIPGARLPSPSSGIGSGALPLGRSLPVPLYHGGNLDGGIGVGTGQSEPVKKKPGRPRKYVPDEKPPSPKSPRSGSPNQKRRRGRPRGSGSKQLASRGKQADSSDGWNLTPHRITIEEGEDVLCKLLLIFGQRQRNFCILSAHGAVSSVVLCKSDASGDTITYEGRFEILCLSGSYILAEDGSRSAHLNIIVYGPNNGLIGGRVGGQLTAATPVQVVLASFSHSGSMTQSKNNGPTVNQVQQQISKNEECPW